MHDIDLQLEPNEASDLCPVFDESTLAKHGWDRAFITVLDEASIEDAIALVVHDASRGDGEGWDCRAVGLDPSTETNTQDAEACAVHDGHVYVLGSQFGKKDGPLEAKRSFAARVREADLAEAIEGGDAPLEVARLRFGIHRAVNDALGAVAGTVELLELGPLSREKYIDETIRLGAAEGKRWSGRIVSADHPINVEGCAFRPGGRLLLGLRYPVTADGHPILVELDDVEALFAGEDPLPRCSHVWVLEDVGDRECPMGVRALHHEGGDRFHAVVGNLDAAGKGAIVLEDHPQGRVATSRHVRFSLPALAAGGPLASDTVRDFDDHRRIEGISIDGDGRAHYVIDHDGRVDLRVAAA